MAQKKKGKNTQKGVIDIEEARRIRREKRQALAAEKKKKEKKEVKKVSPRRSLRKARRRLVFAAVFIGIVIMAGYSVVNFVTVNADRNEVLAENRSLMEEKERLLNQLEHVMTDEFIEQQARRELHLIKPGETRFIFPEDEGQDNIEGSQEDKDSSEDD